MAKRNETPATVDVAALQQEITELKDLIRVLTDVMDEVRVELQCLNRNGVPAGEPVPTVPVLKQMAADPCADDWNERLVIDRGDSDSVPAEARHQPASQPTNPPPGKLF